MARFRNAPARRRRGERVARGRQPDGAVLIFVLGLIGFLTCLPLAVVAWIMGNTYVDRCRAARVTPDGLGVAGRILGMLAVFLNALGLIIVLLFLFAMKSGGQL